MRALAALILVLLLPASAHALSLQPVGSFTTPIYVAAPPGDASRLFVVERGGAVRLVKDGVTLATPFLTIPAGELSTDGERGLLALAFAPDYATSGRLYTYSTDAGGDIRVDLWQRSSNPDVALPARTLVLRIEHSLRNNHNGGDLHFGPDGLLYVSTGDGGGADDPDNNGQTLIRAGTPDEQSTALLGKLLRIAPGAAGGYAIPPDNPFVGRADARGEIYAYGLRNPFRFSFDRATGDLLIGDVGQDDAEEVNYSATRGRGANFGWKCFEGSCPERRDDPAVHPARPRPAGLPVRPGGLPVDHGRLRRPRPGPADPARPLRLRRLLRRRDPLDRAEHRRRRRVDGHRRRGLHARRVRRGRLRAHLRRAALGRGLAARRRRGEPVPGSRAAAATAATARRRRRRRRRATPTATACPTRATAARPRRTARATAAPRS